MDSWNNANSTFVEHLVALKETKMVFPKKAAIIGLGTLLAVGAVALGLTVLRKYFSLLPFAVALIGFLVWYLWRFVSVEFEYSIMQGEISFDIIYGKTSRKSLYTAPISKIEKIGYAAKSPCRETADKTVFAASEMANPNTIWALIREEGGGKTLLYFEITEKAEKALRRENGRLFFGI